ncbi:MAG: hypothetical protein CTY12_04960 [Methylotenera sp.]|nr:MAG: hypothetical protein CTY12_04960 [Methylotenera sp.]
MSELQEEKETSEMVTPDVKDLRKQEWKRAVEAELQPLIIEAARLRGIISTAKTKTKRDLYQKKFNKIHGTVLQYVDLIQKLEATMHLEDPADAAVTTNVE